MVSGKYYYTKPMSKIAVALCRIDSCTVENNNNWQSEREVGDRFV
jgi:hypothetical protein